VNDIGTCKYSPKLNHSIKSNNAVYFYSDRSTTRFNSETNFMATTETHIRTWHANIQKTACKDNSNKKKKKNILCH